MHYTSYIVLYIYIFDTHFTGYKSNERYIIYVQYVGNRYNVFVCSVVLYMQGMLHILPTYTISFYV